MAVIHKSYCLDHGISFFLKKHGGLKLKESIVSPKEGTLLHPSSWTSNSVLMKLIPSFFREKKSFSVVQAVQF